MLLVVYQTQLTTYDKYKYLSLNPAYPAGGGEAKPLDTETLGGGGRRERPHGARGPGTRRREGPDEGARQRPGGRRRGEVQHAV